MVWLWFGCDYSLLSQLCVDERFDGRSLAAAAVDYALMATHLKNHKNYNPHWLDKMNSLPSAVGCKVLSPPFIELIQKERKLISPKINACIENTKHVSPIPQEEEMRGEKRGHTLTEENTKRARMSSPIVESIGQKDHSAHSPPPIQLSSHSTTSPPPEQLPSQSTHSFFPEQFSSQSEHSTPSTQSVLYYASTDPAPLISTESTSSDPPPLFTTQVSTQSLPTMVLPSTESVDSPAPLFVSQGVNQEQEDVPLFSF